MVFEECVCRGERQCIWFRNAGLQLTVTALSGCMAVRTASEMTAGCHTLIWSRVVWLPLVAGGCIFR